MNAIEKNIKIIYTNGGAEMYYGYCDINNSYITIIYKHGSIIHELSIPLHNIREVETYLN